MYKTFVNARHNVTLCIHCICLILSIKDKELHSTAFDVQGGSNMTGTDLCVNKPHCAAAVRP